MGLTLFHSLPFACVLTEDIIAFCMDEHPREEVTLDTNPLALPQVWSVFKLAITLKNHIVPFQIRKKSYILTCALLPQLFFNLKNCKEHKKMYLFYCVFRGQKVN